MKKIICYAGLDVHKDTISIATIKEGAVTHDLYEKLPNTDKGVKTLIKIINAQNAKEVCYEAGPTGYQLKRILEKANIHCVVVAPSLIPTTASAKKRKNDKRDAKQLAKLLRIGQLTEINVVNEAQEAARDFMRLRETLSERVKASKKQLLSLLLRHGLVFRESKNWTLKHMAWLNSLKFEDSCLQYTFDIYLKHIIDSKTEIEEMAKEIEKLADSEPYREKVKQLCAFKGIQTLTAMIILCEIVDFRRFKTAESLMSYLGLISSEYSSGGTEKRGRITKDGNKHVRTALVGTSWHYQYKTISKNLLERQSFATKGTKKHALKAVSRLNRRYRYLVARGKCNQKAIVAVARELAGFIWAVMVDFENQTLLPV